MDPELKEISIWGGSALVVVLLGWFYLSSVAADTVAINAEAARLYTDYARFYKTDTAGRVPAERARQIITAGVQRQSEELEEVERRVLVPQPTEDLPAVDVYASAATWAAQRVRSLKNRAERMNLPFVKELPYEASGSLSEDPTTLRLQLRQIHAYDLLLRRLMDAGPMRIKECALDRPSTDPGQNYLCLPVEVVLTVTYEVLDRILEEFRDGFLPGGGMLNLEQVQIQRGDDKVYSLVMVVNILTPADGSEAVGVDGGGADNRAPASGGGRQGRGVQYRTVPAPRDGGRNATPGRGR